MPQVAVVPHDNVVGMIHAHKEAILQDLSAKFQAIAKYFQEGARPVAVAQPEAPRQPSEEELAARAEAERAELEQRKQQFLTILRDNNRQVPFIEQIVANASASEFIALCKSFGLI